MKLLVFMKPNINYLLLSILGVFSFLLLSSFYSKSFQYLNISSLETPPTIIGTWHSMNGGVEYGSVYTLMTDNQGNLFVGGSFKKAGGVSKMHFAKWNSSSWGNGSNSSGFDKSVNDLIYTNQGVLCATGDFNIAGLNNVDHIAYSLFGGVFWTPMAGGLSIEGKLLTSDIYGNIYVSGNFSSVDNQSISGLAKWDGTQWSAVGQPMIQRIDAMTTNKDGIFYAAGGFAVSGTPTPAIVSFDGSSWDILGVPNHEVKDIAIDTSGHVIVVGSFWQVDDVPAYRMIKWTGSSWIAMDLPPNHFPNVLLVDGDNNIYVGATKPNVGGFLDGVVIRWNGEIWEQLGQSLDKRVLALAIDTSGNLYAGGDFNSYNHIAKFSEQVTPFPEYPAQTLVTNDSPEKLSSINIYPNPVNGRLFIEPAKDLTRINILNSIGQTVLQFNNPENYLDVSALKPGIYYVQLELNGKNEVLKIMVQ